MIDTPDLMLRLFLGKCVHKHYKWLPKEYIEVPKCKYKEQGCACVEGSPIPVWVKECLECGEVLRNLGSRTGGKGAK